MSELGNGRAILFPDAKTPVAMIGYSGGGPCDGGGERAAARLRARAEPRRRRCGRRAHGRPRLAGLRRRGREHGRDLRRRAVFDRAFPGFDLQSLLNDTGKALVEQAKSGCATSLGLGGGQKAAEFTTVPDFLGVPRVKRTLEANALGHLGTPAVPSFYYHAVHDELVWVKPVDALIAGYCADGAPIQYQRDEQGQSHTEGIAAFAAMGVRFVEERFAGAAFASNCSAQRNPTTGRAACTSRRSLVLHPRVRGLHVRRLGLFVDGKRRKSPPARARRVAVSLKGHRPGVARVTITADGTRKGKRRHVRDRRTYHLCAGR